MFRPRNNQHRLPRSVASAVLVLVGSAVCAEHVSDAGNNTPMPMAGSLLSTSLLESSGARIGRVWIVNRNIFDLERPDENKSLFRLANRLHRPTREGVIRQQLLFSPGERFSSRTIEESERLVRANRYIHDVSIAPVYYQEGLVDIEVRTSDVWTLVPKIGVSRSGGENKTTLGLKDTNFLGTGIALELAHRSDVDRDSLTFKFLDRHLGNSWYTLAAEVADNSDGSEHLLSLAKPFYSLNSRSSRGFSYQNRDQVESFFANGERLSEYRHERDYFEAFIGWSGGLRDGYTRRYTLGIAQDKHEFSAYALSDLATGVIPADRHFIYPFVEFELLQDSFDKVRNQDQIGLVEDQFTGLRVTARAGMATRQLGSDRIALLLTGSLERGFRDNDGRTLLMSGGLAGRLEESGLQNVVADIGLRYFRRQSDRRLLYVALSAGYGYRLEADQFFLLGGDSGLRGYPLRYQVGDRRALLTIEQRFFTDWYPWRLFRVGGAVFFDAGRAWGQSPSPGSNSQPGLLKNVGAGLRIGNDRSGLGRMIHVDVAMPLDRSPGIDGLQFLISTRKSF